MSAKTPCRLYESGFYVGLDTMLYNKLKINNNYDKKAGSNSYV